MQGIDILYTVEASERLQGALLPCARTEAPRRLNAYIPMNW